MILVLKLCMMDRHGNYDMALAAAQLDAVNIAGVRPPDRNVQFIVFSWGRAHMRRRIMTFHLLWFIGGLQTNVQGACCHRLCLWRSVHGVHKSEHNVSQTTLHSDREVFLMRWHSALTPFRYLDNSSQYRLHFNTKWEGVVINQLIRIWFVTWHCLRKTMQGWARTFSVNKLQTKTHIYTNVYRRCWFRWHVCDIISPRDGSKVYILYI